MKNFDAYDGDSADFFQLTVSRKEDPALQQRLIGILNDIRASYALYDQHWNDRTLTVLQNNNIFTPLRDDLKGLYDYNSVAIRQLRQNVHLRMPQTIRYTCQYCTVTPVESLDHYIPKEEFPEYSIHANNLVPCCKTCNGHKSYVWRGGQGQRLFINFYRDLLLEQQFLFCEVLEDNGEVDFRFYIDNVVGLGQQEFDMIESHFTRLHLRERMRMKANGIISELETTITLSSLPLADVIVEVETSATRNFQSYGANYWKSIAEIAMVRSPIFMQRFVPGVS